MYTEMCMALNFQTDQEILAKIVERLRTKRKLLKLTQKELAAKAGVSFRTIQTLENGGNCTMLNFIAIIRSLGEMNLLSPMMKEDTNEASPKEIFEANRKTK